MPSTLGWIDHDAHARERITRVLALFREKESRDELGLGGISSSISDQLFPGTSTIQTRLRYMMFVPWLYRAMEDEGVASDDVERIARKRECALIVPLLDKNEEGVLGKRARGDLKRLPSAVYWAALQSWGLTWVVGGQTDYHRGFDRMHDARAHADDRDDDEAHVLRARTWHEGIPAPPEGFPVDVTFRLRAVEAEYLRDRVCEQHPDSLLAWLARDPEGVPEVDFIWMHPRRSDFHAEHSELVLHAHVFSEVMYGAAILYNLELARLRKSDDLIGDHTRYLQTWSERLSGSVLHRQVLDWSLARFWALVCGKGATITELTQGFVAAWLSLVRSGQVDSEEARRLVRARESMLKKAQSRFVSPRALLQWSGMSGLRGMDFRWNVALRLLGDLQDGLANKEDL